MIILDRNVLSALMRRTPDPQVVAWLDAQPRKSVSITAVTVLEVRFGLQIVPAGKRRTTLTSGLRTVRDTMVARIILAHCATLATAAVISKIPALHHRPRVSPASAAPPYRPDGRVMLDLRHRWADGTTQLPFEPVDLLERLAALTLRPRVSRLNQCESHIC